MKRVAVGSLNPVKVNSAKVGLEEYFESVLVTGFNSPSGVPDQPVGDKQTKQGAENRARAAWEAFTTANDGVTPDFSVGMEGGISGMDPTDEMECFAYIAIFDGQSMGIAKTAMFYLPTAISSLVRGGMELGDADDAVFKTKDSKRGDGTVGALTLGKINRTQYYSPAVVLAMCKFNFPDLYA